MKKIVKNIVKDLEDKISTHKSLALSYESQNDVATTDRHYTAVFAYEMALYIVKKHHKEERILTFGK